MDRSVDSIGSCSLDVDADSTDFSDTSGELNFLTPISGKDITREFTAGIKERCMLPVINCQAVTSVLDPVTGHISTVLTTTTAANGQQQLQQAQQPLLGGGDSSPTAATNKKPSYLNLACCVNGYSNLTTYDSKLRQDINKSREVSPSRPIIATLHYNRTESGTGGHLLAAPTLSYVSMNNTINNNNNNNNSYSSTTGGNRMLKMNGAGVVNGGAGRMRGMNGSGILSPPTGSDMTDNVGMFNGNGSFAGSMRTKVISSQSQISSHTKRVDEAASQMLMTPKKSFIQQRVEKLYGASEVVVLNKQNYSSSERKYLNNIANDNNSGGTPVKLAHHTSSVGQQSMGNGTCRNGVANGGGGGGAAAGLHVTNGGSSNGTTFSSLDENNRQMNGGDGSEEADVESLPVLRHLRPEFRAQLQIFSPKKIPKPLPNKCAAVNGNATVTHANGNTAEENVTLHLGPKRYSQSNGNSYTDHLEQQQHHSLVREEQDHRTAVTNRTTMVVKSSRISNGGMATISTFPSDGNGPTKTTVHEEQQQEEEHALKTSNHHHSNATSSTTTEAKQHTDVTVQQHHHETASQSYRSTNMSTTTSTTTTVSSSSAVIVEEKMRSLVVVSSTNPDDNGVGRMSTADGSSDTTIAAQPDEQPNPTTVDVAATSVIENGKQQNGVRQSSGSTDGFASVPAAVKAKDISVGGNDGGEIVNCDNRSIQSAAENAMRTSNGDGSSTVVMESAASVILPAKMADFAHPAVEVDNIQSNGKLSSTLTSFTEVTTNGTDSDSSSNNNNIVLDGNHFLRILKTEQNRLKAMADVVEQEIVQLKADGVELGEDINGYILVAVGKARLLCSQKMKQFEDLCYTNLNQSPDEKFQTTGEDLRGFWDMVMLQVNNVDASFAEIDSFRKNGWRKPIPKSPPPAQARNGTATRTKLVKRPYKTGTTANGGSTVTDGSSNGVEAKKASAALAAAKREAQRKQLLEMKRKQKLANSQQQTAVEIFAPAGSDEPAQNGDDAKCSTAGPPVGTATASTTTLVDTS